VVHRSLFVKSPPTHSALSEAADHISLTERNSADAERASKDVKLFAFLNGQLSSGHPSIYPALVTDVRNFGFFVDVPDLAMSGLVPLSTLADDFYVFDQNRGHLVGRRTRQIIRLGDKLNVQVAKVDTFKKQVDFRLAARSRPPAVGSKPQRQGHTQNKFKPSQNKRPAKSHRNQGRRFVA
jgi:ribonuclease R